MGSTLRKLLDENDSLKDRLESLKLEHRQQVKQEQLRVAYIATTQKGWPRSSYYSIIMHTGKRVDNYYRRLYRYYVTIC